MTSPKLRSSRRGVVSSSPVVFSPAVILPLWIAVSCSDPVVESETVAPRAVTAIEQVVRDPARKLRIAGAAGAWKRETLSFQVGGRVVWVTAPEKSVSGPSIDEEFLPARDGQVIARIDPERYQNALDLARASLAATRANLRATQQQLEQVLPQDLVKADAELRRATDNRDRIERAVARNAVAPTELTNAAAAVETATAEIESIRGRMQAQQSELESLQARVQEAEQAELSAQLDLRDTELRAPFAGRVTRVEVVPGALVQPGTPIVDLVMMDPIKIDVTVSTQAARELRGQDEGLVFLEGRDEPLIANLYQRDSTTDTATRTIRLALICRNEQIASANGGAEIIEDVIPLIQFPSGAGRAWFIERRCVQRDEAGTFAWRVVAEDPRKVTGEVFSLERMPIELGEARKDFVGLFQFREVVPSQAMLPLLASADSITVRKLLFGLGVSESFRGGPATVVGKAWTMQPGDVVDVQLDLDAAGPGIYVPATAVDHAGEQAFVYVVRGERGQQRLERVDVEVSGRVGSDVRIADAPLADGAPIVDRGTHVLTADESVQVTSMRAAR